MTALKLERIGNSMGVSVPKEVLARLKVGQGDALFVAQARNGVTSVPYDPVFEQQLSARRMRKRPDVLREPAQ